MVDGCPLKKCPFDKRVALIFQLKGTEQFNVAADASGQKQPGSARASHARGDECEPEEAVVFSLKLKQVLHVLSMEQHVSSVDAESASKTL